MEFGKCMVLHNLELGMDMDKHKEHLELGIHMEELDMDIQQLGLDIHMLDSDKHIPELGKDIDIDKDNRNLHNPQLHNQELSPSL